jgi:hypothetical protein
MTLIIFYEAPHYEFFFRFLSFPHAWIEIFSSESCSQITSTCVLPLSVRDDQVTYPLETKKNRVVVVMMMMELVMRGCIQKFPDWLPGARTSNGIALCH